MDDPQSTQPLLGHPKADEDDSITGVSNAEGPQFYHSDPHIHDATSSSSLPATSPSHIQGHAAEFRTYKRRWYILILYSLAAATQCAVWSTFGPISTTSEDAFGWHDSTIALLSNWGPISYLVFGVFSSWMLDVKGLRVSCLTAIFLVALGTVLRCITMDPPAVTWLMHVGQMLNGLSGPVYMAGPVVISAVWFPPSQRTTATAIGSLFGAVGSAGCFLLGPYLVPEAPSNTTNTTNTTTSYYGMYGPVSTHLLHPGELQNGSFVTSEHLEDIQSTSDTHRVHRERKAIHLYMYIEAGWSVALFLMTVIYFPSKPPLPPCPSAAIQREQFLTGAKHLLKHGQFWLVCFVYGVSTGVLYVWDSVLNVILKPHHIEEKEAGWIGFYGSCGSIVASLLVARVADHLKRVMKWMVLIFFVVATASVLVFTLATNGVIPPSKALLICTNVLTHMMLDAAVPLLFELACETAYPTGEGTANVVITMINNAAGLAFLFIMMIPHIGTVWTNWTLLGAVAICVPALLLMKNRFHRLDIDEHNPSLTAEITIPSGVDQTPVTSVED